MKLTRILALVLGLCLVRAAAARGIEQTITLGGLLVTVWTDAPPAETGQPIVIFSHGFHGCSTQSRFLMEALASSGYIVFAPNHADATCNGGSANWTDPPEEPFQQQDLWSDATFLDRQQDIERLIEAIKSDARFRSRVDWSRFALAGHSLGGYTVLGLSGAWASWRLTGVKAVLALSPYDQPFILDETLVGLAAPVMYQGGTLDYGITPSVRKPNGGYDQSPASKYFVEFTGAGHLAWTDDGKAAHNQIVAYSVAFFDHYVNGNPAARLLTDPIPGVSLLRYDSELGNNGRGKGFGRGIVVTRP